MTEKLRFGLLGCGVIGPTHAEALASLPEAQLVAVADIVPAVAQKLANRYNVTPHTSLSESLWQAGAWQRDCALVAFTKILR